MNCALDCEFLHHGPNLLDPASRVPLTAAVRKHGLDAGVFFDGDADRVMFLDETGAFLQPDFLIPLLAPFV